MNTITNKELLELIQLKLKEGLTPTQLFLFLYEGGYNSFTGKPFTIPTLFTTLKTIENPSFRPSSVIAQLLKQQSEVK